MLHSRTVEIGVGVFVAAGLAALFMLAMKVSNLSTFKAENGCDRLVMVWCGSTEIFLHRACSGLM